MKKEPSGNVLVVDLHPLSIVPAILPVRGLMKNGTGALRTPAESRPEKRTGKKLPSV